MRRSVIALVSILALASLVVSCSTSREPEKARSTGVTEQDADAGTSQAAADGEEGGDGDADRAVAPARIEAAAEAKGRKAPTANVAAAPAAGWQSETVWNASQNDWEPAVATDPSSSRVYELTTRYGGPKACQQCPDPAIIFRSCRKYRCSSAAGVATSPSTTTLSARILITPAAAGAPIADANAGAARKQRRRPSHGTST